MKTILYITRFIVNIPLVPIFISQIKNIIKYYKIFKTGFNIDYTIQALNGYIFGAILALLLLIVPNYLFYRLVSGKARNGKLSTEWLFITDITLIVCSILFLLYASSMATI